MTSPLDNLAAHTRYVDAPNLSVSAGGIAFAYRDLGPRDGVPLVASIA